jgi:hypothetical protein
MLPETLIPLFSLILPWIEFLAGCFLILGIFLKSNALLLTILLLMFTTATITANIRGIDTECGCFSTSGGGKADFGLLFRNMLILFCGLQIFLGTYSYLALENLFVNRRHSGNPSD